MPISDMIFCAIGAADFAFVLLLVAFTGFITHQEAHTAENEKLAEDGKPTA